MLSICRLKQFLEMSDVMLEYFKPNLGRIEIIGGAKRIERVYFNIRPSRFENRVNIKKTRKLRLFL